MTATLNLIRESIRTGFYVALLLLLILCAPSIIDASHALLGKASSVTTLEVAGVKIGFDQASVASQLDYPHLSTADKDKVLEKMKTLEPDEFERLMHVGQFRNLCDYEKPTVEMRRMMTLDYQLSEKHLASVINSPDLFAEVSAEIKSGEKKSGKLSDIGYPRSCYVVELTDLGRNTKTALVRLLSGAFEPHVASKQDDEKVHHAHDKGV